MFKRAQDMLELVQDGVKTTLRVVADLAESVGVPPSVTALFQPGNGADQWKIRTTAAAHARTEAPRTEAPHTEVSHTEVPHTEEREAQADLQLGDEGDNDAAGVRPTTKRRPVVGDRQRSKGIRPLEVDDAIDGSTYLARIIWSLGVAELEGIGPLRPADIARMVMSRSAVSLEPPNVARYIRRSKPTTIVVAHVEGGSNFYQLNDKGQDLFRARFGLN